MTGPKATAADRALVNVIGWGCGLSILATGLAIAGAAWVWFIRLVRCP